MSNPLPALPRAKADYAKIAAIDGSHPFRQCGENVCVDYPARQRRGGRVFYFNFALAREMGLLDTQHPDKLNSDLERVLLNTFAIQIINDYDQHHGVRIPQADIKPGLYMATRYLQLQHKDKRGLTSGDGRSLWNGSVSYRGTTWDVTSCGTGTTRLSPAAQGGKNIIKTGDNARGYGNGQATLEDGLMAAIMSEIYHRAGVATERTLLIIAFADNTSINVRAGKNLLRPAHLFAQLKQSNLVTLQAIADYYIEREIDNGNMLRKKNRSAQYRVLLDTVCHDFAKAAALFETDYIFCWLAWDGDNILMNSGIIDYGSIRQFGLFHNEYRYDDVEQWSTNISEQRQHARYIVQTFAQLVDYLITRHKKPITHFRKAPILKLFDKHFDYYRNYFTLRNIGYDENTIPKLLSNQKFYFSVTEFRTVCRHFESAKAHSGLYEVSDGITWDAIFCIRDVLRELPSRLLATGHAFTDAEFMDILRSDYAEESDLDLYPYRKKMIRAFQAQYQQLIHLATKLLNQSNLKLLTQIQLRAQIINREQRLTGDGLIHATHLILKHRSELDTASLNTLLLNFYQTQLLEKHRAVSPRDASSLTKKLLFTLQEVVAEYRESI